MEQKEQTKSVIELVAKVAEMADLKYQVLENDTEYSLKLIFGFEDGRSQVVLVNAFPNGPGPKAWICARSFARKIKKGLFSGANKDTFVDLLKKNTETFGYRFSISERDDEIWVWVSSDALVETLDPEELESMCYMVARAADKYEEEHHGDADEF